MKMKPEEGEKQVTAWSDERDTALRSVINRLVMKTKKLPNEDEQKMCTLLMLTLKAFQPGPRVSRIMGEFLIDLANTVEEIDRKEGTDTNDPNQLTAVVVRKEKKDGYPDNSNN